ncbi:soluble epoxide hydrolase [Dothidotthia symphoricarpi CBS 119687]|uniref:Soluble epoxide hydrolase n=1 Tax=Dothidotthia symphoricarpi CBS 119687 TaxID=1392245 RepID=A0A6A6A238_9PLEO|nr:soluble epoxide hydrolase [Dothidotthia symphoricarpi CBS 119687]KAF2125244.1 soluble epoxide hydrolase [Dothidotthia symphoricarpi CBS 119687]
MSTLTSKSDRGVVRNTIATVTTSSGEQLRISYTDRHCAPEACFRGVIVLVHGFPQTSYQFRHVIQPLSDAGYRVIAPDYRGAGQSSKPTNGYEKSQMAEDIFMLIRYHIGIKRKIHIVGHDIGGMIAFAYASRYPEHVASLIWGECPLPGSTFYEQVKSMPDAFHFVFHRILDLPEALIAGREAIYLKHFFDKQSYNGGAITQLDLDFYTNAYSQPGAMRAGMNVYRAFEKDAEENIKLIEERGKTKVPTLGMAANNFILKDHTVDMMEEMHNGAEITIVENSGHYIAEENPDGFVDMVLGFVSKHESA